MQRALEPTADSAWLLLEHGYDPLRESDIESCFTIGNGFLGVRAARAVSRGPMWLSWVLMPAADCLRVHIRLNGEPLQLRLGHMLSHCRTLDMRRGLLTVDWHQRDASGIVVRVRSLRLVS